MIVFVLFLVVLLLLVLFDNFDTLLRLNMFFYALFVFSWLTISLFFG